MPALGEFNDGGSSEEEEEDGDDESCDESDDDSEDYDYGYADDDEDYEVDLTNTNMSSDLLALLGHSAEKVEETRVLNQANCDWKPPEQTGLSNSEAIVPQVLAPPVLSNTAADDQGTKKSQDGAMSDAKKTASDAPLGASSHGPQVLLPGGSLGAPLAIRLQAFEPVDLSRDKRAVEKLGPPPPAAAHEDSDAEDGSDCGSDGSYEEWDVASLGDWSDIDETDDSSRLESMSPNLLRLLGLADKADEVTNNLSKEPAWVPPAAPGLHNSSAIATLAPIRVQANVEVQEPGEEEWGSDDESEYDFDEVDDDTYITNWMTNVSANLLSLLGGIADDQRQEFSAGNWQPPPESGLENSRPIVSS